VQRVDVLRTEWPLHASAATRAIEREASAALPAHTLMRRAGMATARLALALEPHAPRWWIAAGPGNNGGDGLEAALQLRRAGKQVQVGLLGDAARLPADAADALARAQAAGVSIAEGLDGANDADEPAIDALLGLGTSRAPAGPLAAALARLNARRGIVLAIDLPSGLDAGSGRLFGDAAVRATHTLSLLTLKPGLYTGAGRDHAGEVWLDTLGMELDANLADALLSGGAHCLQRPPRRHAQHKGSFGDVLVVGGAPGMLGAAVLASRAAHAAGAGRVYVSLLDERGAPTHDALRPELMFRPRAWQRPPAEIAAGTLLAGCGGGDAVRAALPALLSNATRLVLDADALNAIAADASLQSLLAARAARGRATVLTPHPLEAARLLACSATEVQADRLDAAVRLVQHYGCVVLLKGSGSVVASPRARPNINPTGNAALATAGTGDVLAGWIAGLWAQVGDDADAHTVAVRAAFRHGLAAEGGAVAPLRASELIERMHALG